MHQHPLSGRTALVTGASRRKGIGFAVACELAALGANVFIHHFQAHDTAQPWGGDDLDAVQIGDSDAAGARPGDRTASARPSEKPTGHVIWMTSGQLDGPMRGEVAYATSKAALAGVTKTAAAELLDVGVVLNTVNPGPVNTGYLDADTTDRDLDWVPEFLASTPFGRFGHPDDPARLIGWLCTDAGSWVVGQVLTSDGGFALR